MTTNLNSSYDVELSPIFPLNRLFVGSLDYDDSIFDVTHHEAKSNCFYYY